MTTLLSRSPKQGLPPVGDPPSRRFSVKEYHQLIDIGILGPKDPYHLLNGVIRYKMPQNAPHISTTMKLSQLFWLMLAGKYLVLTDKPVTFINSQSEPEPDFAITLGPITRFDEVKPASNEVLLIVEVSYSTLVADRGEMMEIYAGGKIPEYWIVNLVDNIIEVYTNPRGGKKPTFRTHTDYTAGQSVPVILQGKQIGMIAVSAILPGG